MTSYLAFGCFDEALVSDADISRTAALAFSFALLLSDFRRLFWHIRS